MCQGWPTATPNDLIPEFYSNFLNINTTTLEFDVFLRKKKYHISPDVVAAALNIPRVDQPGYPFIDQLVPLRDNMMELFVVSLLHGEQKNQIPQHSSHVRLVYLIW
jgi:hypothetical protein